MDEFERVLALAARRAGAAFRTQSGWVDAVRAGLVALLEFFDEEPAIARYLVVESALAGPAVQARRCEVLDRLAMLLDDERAPARAYPPPLTALAVASGVLGVLHARLSAPEPGSLVDLAGSLMSFMVTPFLGARAARRELRRPSKTVGSSPAGMDLLQGPGRRLSHRREILVIAVLASEAGLNNREVALRAGVADEGHASRMLARLARLGLIEDTRSPGRPAGVKAWQLTAAGEQLHAELQSEASAATPDLLSGLGEEFAGLDFWAVCVLRAVGEQPWLTSGELAARAGVEDTAQMSRLLSLLSGLGLIDSVRDAHRRGMPKVWQLTSRGRELQETIGGTAPKRPPSVALDLMRQTGGRLSDRAIQVLVTIVREHGLSNGQIAKRTGTTDANSMSQHLGRLTQRGLIENARSGGRENIWVPTAAGTRLHDAIRHEDSAPLSRNVALDALKEAGGRLNHRVVSVVQTIAAEPGLNNSEISERIGVDSKAHASRLLTRLARYGLIENHAPNAVPFEANAWRLTASGRQLERTIRDDTPPSSPRASRNGQGLNLTAMRS